MTMFFTQTLGWIATALFTAAFIPQILKITRTKHVEGVSSPLFWITLVADVIAFEYARELHQWPLEIKYTLGFLFVAWVLIEYYKNN